MAAPESEEMASEEVRDRLRAVIERGADTTMGEAEFTDLARLVFAYQYERNDLYRRFCDARGIAPSRVEDWRDVPAVPTDAFKATPLVVGDPAAAAVVFRTSGTTAGEHRRGAHYFPETGLYEAALLRSFERFCVPDLRRIRILSLVPSVEEAPESSLSFMIDKVINEFGDAGSAPFVTASGMRSEALLGALTESTAEGAPVLIAGTSFAFVHLLDELGARGRKFRLPPGSRVMDTGGFKGRSREVGRPELYAWIEEGLGVPQEFIVNEYGMTEMSSQFYDGVVGSATPISLGTRWHVGPPWVRSVAVDPYSLSPLPAGQPGILRHVDLANLYSVAALQTADRGIVTEAGVELMGRSAGAEPRGCSIAMDELLGLMRRG